MLEMSFKDLFDVGKNFEETVGEGTKVERLRIPKNYSRIILDDYLIDFVKEINCEVNVLVSGEIWCPDFQLNVTCLKKFEELNSNFNISIITMARGKKYLAPLLNIDKESLKGPTIVFLTKDFEILGLFEERPKAVVNLNFEEIKLDYYKGQYLSDTCSDFVGVLKAI